MAWTSKTKWSAADAECQFGFGQSVGLASSKSGSFGADMNLWLSAAAIKLHCRLEDRRIIQRPTRSSIPAMRACFCD
jgi:hypothetical protein